MKKDITYIIFFILFIICGVIYFYYTGKNGRVGRTEVFYAVSNDALPLFIIKQLLILWFPFSVLFAHCADYFYHSVVHKQSLKKDFHINFRYVVYVYIGIIIFKILQLHLGGEYIITEIGDLKFLPPCSIKEAGMNVLSISNLGRHIFWILDGIASSYLLTRVTRIK